LSYRSLFNEQELTNLTYIDSKHFIVYFEVSK